MNELEIMNTLSRNKYHPWKLITSCNIRSLNCHFHDFKLTPKVEKTDVICFQETWITNLPTNAELIFEGFQRHFNSAGYGKGIATYYRGGYYFNSKITRNEYQMTKIISKQYEIINIYRSASAQSSLFIEDIRDFISLSKETFLVGDFNVCYLSEFHHPIIQFILSSGFTQLVKRPTHIGGRLIDHIYHYQPNSNNTVDEFTINHCSPFSTDHDVLTVVQVSNY